MTELQAALGLSQLQRIDEFVARRRHLAKRYDHALNALPLRCPKQHEEGESAYHLYPIVLQDTSRRLTVFNALRAAGIGVNVHYIPVHTQPYYQQRGYRYGDYPIAEAYYAGAISLPIYADLSNDQQDFIITTLKQVLA
jgi:dTDP-4-amino-4,6-dideoxygalactose transaminase